MVRRPFVLGLTGSIGMGKSTTATFFREMGIPVWDADAAVHRLYAKGGAAVEPIGLLFPGAISEGCVNRHVLRERIRGDDGAIGKIETIVHPLVAADRLEFIATMGAKGEKLVVVDIPLLFETGAEKSVDATLVVTTTPEIQRQRVLERGEMSEADFQKILANQMPDTEKRQRADHVIETLTLKGARNAARNLVGLLMERIERHA